MFSALSYCAKCHTPLSFNHNLCPKCDYYDGEILKFILKRRPKNLLLRLYISIFCRKDEE